MCEGKADKADVSSLLTIVEQKADTFTVQDLRSQVQQGKQDLVDLAALLVREKTERREVESAHAKLSHAQA